MLFERLRSRVKKFETETTIRGSVDKVVEETNIHSGEPGPYKWNIGETPPTMTPEEFRDLVGPLAVRNLSGRVSPFEFEYDPEASKLATDEFNQVDPAAPLPPPDSVYVVLNKVG